MPNEKPASAFGTPTRSNAPKRPPAASIRLSIDRKPPCGTQRGNAPAVAVPPRARAGSGGARAPYHPAGPGAGVTAAGDRADAVHEYGVDAVGEPVRIRERRPVGDTRGIEQHDVRERAGPDDAAIGEAERRRGKAGHAVHGFG